MWAVVVCSLLRSLLSRGGVAALGTTLSLADQEPLARSSALLYSTTLPVGKRCAKFPGVTFSNVA